MSSSDNTKVVASAAPTPMFLLFLTFLVLKLTSVIDWSWWWVTAPLWGPIVLVLGIIALVLLVFGVVAGIAGLVGLAFKKKVQKIGMRMPGSR